MTVQELNTLFGKNVKYYRKKKGMKSGKLANEMGISPVTLSGYERGHNLASGRQLVLLAYVLEVDVWKLFYNGEIKDNPELLQEAKA